MNRLLGIYIECSDGSLAGARVSLVEETASGRVIMRAADEGNASKVAAVMSKLSAADIASTMAGLYPDSDTELAS